MKNFYRFQIRQKASLDGAWRQLEQAGVEIAYSCEEEETKWIYGYLGRANSIPNLRAVVDVQVTEPAEIDWEAQWMMHGLNFYDGHVCVDLEAIDQKSMRLRLKPGPGFGDLSHPTTRLVLRMMKPIVQDKFFIDIGCGSGVLMLAAVAMGASAAYGIDIDPKALIHAHENAQLNQIEKKCHFCLPDEFDASIKGEVLIAMNMISSEQRQAWKSLPILHSTVETILTSGIRKEERNQYLEQASKWNWKFTKESQEDGWLAFQFERL